MRGCVRHESVRRRARDEDQLGLAVVHDDVEVAGEPLRRRARGSPPASASRGSPRAARPRRPCAVLMVTRLVVSHDSRSTTSATTPASLSSSAVASASPVALRSTPTSAVIVSCSSRRSPPGTRPAVRWSVAGSAHVAQLARQHVGDAAREDESLEQRVGGQPVRAVHAGAGGLAGRVEAGHVGAAPQVGADSAAGVVAGGRDRDQVGDGVDAVRAGGGQDGREPALPELRARGAGRRATCAGARSRASGA